MSRTDLRGQQIATETTTLGAAFRLFASLASPRVLASGLTLAVVARLGAAALGWTPWSRWDVVAVLIVALLVPFVEWFVHLVVLHAEPFRIGRWKIDTAIGHRQHHLHPASVNWVVLRGVDAALFQVINGGVVVVVVGGPMWALGAPVVGPVLTGVVAAVVALLHYEWSHLLFHTAYRPRTRYYRRLKRNHRLHHWRNERYWLGITSNLGDRVLRSHPASAGAVPRSPTARTLGADPEAD